MNYLKELNLEYIKENQLEFEELNFNVLRGETAENISRDQICKTLVLKGDKSGIIIASIPFSRKLNTNKLKKLTGDKKVRFVENVEQITGYPHGANGPIGISRVYPDYKYILDSHFNKYIKIVSNIGEYGNTVITRRKDLILFVGMDVADISDPEK